MSSPTPRVFIAATRQNDGKTTTSLGLLAEIRKRFTRVGYIKPVGQRFVEIEENKIDEDTVLMDSVYHLECPLIDMSPIAVEPDFTRKYLQEANRDFLVNRIRSAFDRVATDKDFVLVEGSGHAGVGSVFDLSNAQVAKELNAKVVIVTRGGIGKPIDEIALNKALFDKIGVEVIGVIINKVIPDKLAFVEEFARKGLKRQGLDLLGVLPHRPTLSRPTMHSLREDLRARVLNDGHSLNALVEDVVLGAMGANNAVKHFKRGMLLITPFDREDIIYAAAAEQDREVNHLAGMVLTGGCEPSPSVLRVIGRLPFPVLLTPCGSYQAASIVHDTIVKTRPDDLQKIDLIRDLIAEHVDVDRLLNAL
ncbi:MAG: AAA family ATPase [Verrucomicrobiae bacterium]|nr:AAA family ATPase [Verrucomicrobiae bacterium]